MVTKGGSPTEEAGHTFRYSLDEGDRPVMAVLDAVSLVSGTDVSELEPLSRVIDPDALNDLFDAPASGAEFYRSSSRADDPGPQVTFEYDGFVVTVSPGQVHVEGT